MGVRSNILVAVNQHVDSGLNLHQRFGEAVEKNSGRFGSFQQLYFLFHPVFFVYAHLMLTILQKENFISDIPDLVLRSVLLDLCLHCRHDCRPCSRAF